MKSNVFMVKKRNYVVTHSKYVLFKQKRPLKNHLFGSFECLFKKFRSLSYSHNLCKCKSFVVKLEDSFFFFFQNELVLHSHNDPLFERNDSRKTENGRNSHAHRHGWLDVHESTRLDSELDDVGSPPLPHVRT